MNRLWLFFCFLCLPWAARGQSAYDWIYWIDSDDTHKHVGTAQGDVFSIIADVDGLEKGLHTIYMQVADMAGRYSPPLSKMFFYADNSLSSMRYWFDDDKDVVQASNYSGEAVMIDVSELSDGFHTIHIQFGESNSCIVSQMFIKVPQTEGDGQITVICTIDEKLLAQHKVASTGGVISWQMPVESIGVGLHRAVFQAITSTGAASTIAERYFVRVISDKEMQGMRCVYSVDNQQTFTQTGSMASGGRFHFDLDVSSLEDGLHRLAYTMVSEEGVTTPQKTAFFWKTPLGGTGIAQYDYWLNDDTENMRSTKFSERENPFRLISLLPLDKHPIRSSCFHFEVKDGQPVIYAKNYFHIRFFDTSFHELNETKQYIDYQVRQDVTDVTPLESGVCSTMEKPEGDAIRWYSIEAEKGDSIQLKLDCAATVQMFAPSGKEVFSASGSESVKWFGCHVWENGTFYVALHDVTATYGNTISIDYNHIDKYAVLRQDVSIVGNSGYSTITFDGNGFDELTSVDLVLGNNTVTPMEVGHESNTTTSVKFDFSNAPLGQYKAVFHFADDELVKEKCITVEEPKDIEFATTVSYNSMFMKWDTNKFVFKINNLGNMTAYNVPMSIFIYTENHDYLTYTKVNGFNLPKFYKNILGEQYTDSLAIVVNREITMSGDKCFFVKAMDEDYLPGSPCVHWASISLDLHPGTNEMTVEVKVDETHRDVSVYLVVPENWENNFEKESSRGWADDAWDDECLEARLLRLHKCSVAYQDYLINDRRDISLLRDNGCIKKSESCKYRPTPGGSAFSMVPGDPNDIYGYTAKSGSHAIKNGQNEVFYTIEFENDPEIATAPAHEIFVTNTLDATKFDLSTFAPTRINIGGKSAELTGDKNFVTTIDMRPEINVIAQVEGTYDQKTGTAKWHISSLDPMTMEPTTYVMDGVLPVNYGGNGIGEVMYDIQLKPGLAHNTKVTNRASIVFDKNEAIQTPVWTNVIDRIAPQSHATGAKLLNDSTAAVSIAATDELSGPWRYDVYVQYGEGSGWWKAAENVPIDQQAKVKVYQGINHGFYTVVTDSAGNVEQKQAAREFTLDVFSPQIETTTNLQLAQGWNWISQNQNVALSAETLKPKAQRIVSQTEELYKDARLGWSGDLTELVPTEMYKVQMSSAASVQLSGLLYNASFRTVPLRKGWNWMGYPVAKTMTPAEALAKLEAEEDDALIGQDGMAQYSGGQWTGTLTTLQPGQGYMYRSASDKELFLNATAQASSRSNFAQSIVPNPPIPEDWTVDKRRYPNVMGIVANLYRNGQKEDADDWTVGAFAGEECRGIAQNVDGRLMMNIYGQGGEQIVFRAMYRESGEVVTISEQEAFRADLIGSVNEPYQLTIGTVTGIVDNERMRNGENEKWQYDLQGRRVNSKTSKGIYIVTDGKKSRTQKVVK